jgi:CRP-like cAMP-binding protein
MSKSQIKKFILLANQKVFNQGDEMVSAGDNSREMFVLLSGEADVCSIAEKGGKKVLENLSAGDVFGELAFLNDAPRSADVIAREHVEALILSPQSVEKIIRADSKIATQVYKNLSGLVARRLVTTSMKSVRG